MVKFCIKKLKSAVSTLLIMALIVCSSLPMVFAEEKTEKGCCDNK